MQRLVEEDADLHQHCWASLRVVRRRICCSWRTQTRTRALSKPPSKQTHRPSDISNVWSLWPISDLHFSRRYGNQAEVAVGLKKAFSEIPGLKREDVFIVRIRRLSFVRSQLTLASLLDLDVQAMEQVRLCCSLAPFVGH